MNIAAACLTERQHQHRAQSLSACVQTVSHGVQQYMVRRVGNVKIVGKRPIHKLFILLIGCLKISHDRPPNQDYSSISNGMETGAPSAPF